MNDLISRQAAIDEVNRLAEFFWEKWHEYAPSTIAVTDALKEIPSAQPWIPCSERLPTTKDDYIITVKDKSLTWTDYVEWSADYHWWGYDDDMVIAWMPLPEPYKGEES